MKKQYVMAMLLLIGFGIVSTMAFELNATEAEVPEAYTVTTDGTNAELESLQIRPSKGGDRMIIKLQLSGPHGPHSDYFIGVELEDEEETNGLYDASGADVDPSENSNTVLADGYIEFDYHKTHHCIDTLIIKIDKDDIWSDVDGIMITIADDNS